MLSATRHPVTRRIDEAIDLLERVGHPVTPGAVRVNVKKRITYTDLTPDEMLEAAIDQRLDRRLKARGYMILDETTRVRGLGLNADVDELDAQLRLQDENVTYVVNSRDALRAVVKFLRAKQAATGAPVRASDFYDEVVAIYEAHGIPASRLVGASHGNGGE